MLRLGYNTKEKQEIIKRYCIGHNIKKVYIFSPEKFTFSVDVESENIRYEDIIMYKFFYRLLKEIDRRSLIVVNECLRTQNRNDLTYNCLRQYLNQTDHQVVFQYLPQIDTFDDFMTLLDFDTKTKYKMRGFEKSMLEGVDLSVKEINIGFDPITVNVSQKTKVAYERKKESMFANIGLKDPHTIPRNLYLMGSKEKILKVEPERRYIGRNNRFKLDNLSTYNEAVSTKSTVFELPHNFINFSDYLYLSLSSVSEVLVTDLKVDIWYMERYNEWAKRIKDGYTNIQ